MTPIRYAWCFYASVRHVILDIMTKYKKQKEKERYVMGWNMKRRGDKFVKY